MQHERTRATKFAEGHHQQKSFSKCSGKTKSSVADVEATKIQGLKITICYKDKEKEVKKVSQPSVKQPTVYAKPGSRPSTTDSLELMLKDPTTQKRKSEVVVTPAQKKIAHQPVEEDLAKENVFLKAQLMSREEEIENFKFALECYQKKDFDDQQSRDQAEEQNPMLEKELKEQASQLKAMQRFATKILKQKEQAEKEVKNKQERIEELEQTVQELGILYEVSVFFFTLTLDCQN